MTTEQALQLCGEVKHVEQRTTGLEIDEHIDVTVGAVLSARTRPEEAHSLCAASSRRGTYLVAVLIDQRSNAHRPNFGHVTRLPASRRSLRPNASVKSRR